MLLAFSRTILALAVITPALSLTTSLDQQAAEPLYCVYPISSHFGILPRCLFYVSLACALGLRHQWLVVGSLLSIMTFTGTSAIYALVLMSSRGRPMIADLDAAVLLSLMGIAVLCFCPLMKWSPNLKTNKSARRIFQMWGFLVALGALAAIEYAQGGLREAECVLGGGTDAECSFQCLSISTATRRSSDAQLVSMHALYSGPRKAVRIFTTVCIAISALGIIFYALSKSLVKEKLEDEVSRIQGSLGVCEHLKERRASFSRLSAKFCAAAALVVLVLNEYYVFKSLPKHEDLHTIGQWSGFVSSGLVIGASAINWMVETTSGTVTYVVEGKAGQGKPNGASSDNLTARENQIHGNSIQDV